MVDPAISGKNLADETTSPINNPMKNTGRKTVRGGKTSAPMVARSTQSPVAALRPAPSREDIARRAYEIFLERGSEHGHDQEHWTQAERDLGKPA
ncbi:MAG: DUF2934 domain-containing protein [Bacteroidota bacterium]